MIYEGSSIPVMLLRPFPQTDTLDRLFASIRVAIPIYDASIFPYGFLRVSVSS